MNTFPEMVDYFFKYGGSCRPKRKEKKNPADAGTVQIKVWQDIAINQK